jgi:hypothetical protein
MRVSGWADPASINVAGPEKSLAGTYRYFVNDSLLIRPWPLRRVRAKASLRSGSGPDPGLWGSPASSSLNHKVPPVA